MDLEQSNLLDSQIQSLKVQKVEHQTEKKDRTVGTALASSSQNNGLFQLFVFLHCSKLSTSHNKCIAVLFCKTF